MRRVFAVMSGCKGDKLGSNVGGEWGSRGREAYGARADKNALILRRLRSF